MDKHKHEEQLDWVEQTQEGQTASVAGANAPFYIPTDPKFPEFDLGRVKLLVGRTRVGKTRLSDAFDILKGDAV